MGKVISVRLSDAEEARIRGAAALSGMPISGYLKWLITNGRTGGQNEAEMILRRLDDIATGISNLRAAPTHVPTSMLSGIPARGTIVTRLPQRGLPSSTIRQVEAILDELAGKAARGPVAA